MANGMNYLDFSTPTKLGDLFEQSASSQEQPIRNEFSRLRKRAVAGQAASGRLRSGLAEYPLAELDRGEGEALSSIRGDLAGKLAGFGAKDFFDEQDFNRQKQLAELIGRLNKPSTLEEIFGGIGAGGQFLGGLGQLGSLFI